MKKNIGFLLVALFLSFVPAFMVQASFESCIAKAIDDREILIQDQNTTFYTVKNTYLNARRNALRTNWLIMTDSNARRAANKLAWQNYNTKMSALRANDLNAKTNIWNNFYAYREQCKLQAVPGTNFDFDESDNLDL